MAAPQSYANHRRFVPAYHFFAFPVFVTNLLWQLWRLVRDPALPTLLEVLVAITLVAFLFYARMFAMRVQDRVIRLEERMRLERLCPADFRPRIDELTAGQLVALRFASDEELPELARRVLDEGLTRRDAIKRQIRNWRPDHLRV